MEILINSRKSPTLTKPYKTKTREKFMTLGVKMVLSKEVVEEEIHMI